MAGGSAARLLFLVCIIMAAALVFDTASGFGVNWGTMASHRIEPEIVVKMLKANGIKKVKLFDADDWTVSATKGTDIELMLGIPNDMLQWISSDYDNAKDWVSENVTDYLSDGINIKYVAVGNEPFLTSYNGTNLKTTMPALQNIQKALNEAGHTSIKATVPHNSDVYQSPSDKPSDGAFRSNINSLMLEMVQFLKQNDAPFVVNIYPFLSLHGNRHFPFEFAFCTDNYSQPISDNEYSYTNVFDANYDTLVWALKKAQAPDLDIIVGEVGWPTDGDIYANVSLAKRFYDGFLKKIASKKGTPLRKGEIVFYLFGLFDEDMKSVEPGFFERHWGIFGYDGKPKFGIDLSGKGADKMLVGVKGVEYLDRQWCVYNPDQVADDMFQIGEFMGEVCAVADCTPMQYGGSCNKLDLHGNYSFVFNQFYQFKDQDSDACNFDGYGHVVKQDPSKGTCVFPIQITGGAFSLRIRPITIFLNSLLLLLLFLFALFL